MAGLLNVKVDAIEHSALVDDKDLYLFEDFGELCHALSDRIDCLRDEPR